MSSVKAIAASKSVIHDALVLISFQMQCFSYFCLGLRAVAVIQHYRFFIEIVRVVAYIN